MWAGVCGGLAEYFDIDPALMRLLWVAAAVVTGGLAVPVYFLAWIILPRDDRAPVTGQQQWRDWSQEFHAETQRLAEEARRMASEWREPESAESPRDPATDKGTTTTTTPSAAPQPASYTPPPPAPSPYSSTPSSTMPEPWAVPSDIEPQPRQGGPSRTTGVILVGLGVLFRSASG
jgi:phage shock protein C